MGKRTKQNAVAVRKLKKIYEEKGITTCELRLEGCANNWALGFAHRHKRRWYYGIEEQLHSFEETVLACSPCHEKIEYDAELTKNTFNRLRPVDFPLATF